MLKNIFFATGLFFVMGAAASADEGAWYISGQIGVRAVEQQTATATKHHHARTSASNELAADDDDDDDSGDDVNSAVNFQVLMDGQYEIRIGHSVRVRSNLHGCQFRKSTARYSASSPAT